MNNSGGGGGGRVSIPNHARKTIQYIKEIDSNHSDEEIYAMLRECSMDPNETVQKLLYQDTFHEVKRKRDRRKENLSNREQPDSTWRAGVQGRGGRGGRGNYSSRYTSSDDHKAETVISQSNCAEIGHSVGATHGRPASTLHQPSSTPPRVHGAVSVPVLLPSNESHNECSVVTMKHESGSQRSTELFGSKVGMHATVRPDLLPSSNEKVTPDFGDANPADISGKHLGKPQTNDVNLMREVSESVSTSNAGSSDSRPSSNYSNRSVQLVGSQKEWKPKQTKADVVQPIGRVISPDLSPTTADGTKSLPVTSTACADTATFVVQNKLEDLHLSDTQHVIFPNHIRIPEAERAGLSFGSFSANFAVRSNFKNDCVSEKGSSPTTQAPEGLDSNDNIQDISSGPQNVSTTVHEDESLDHSESPRGFRETVSTETDLSGSVSAQEFEQSKPEAAPTPSAPQYALVQSPHAYSSFGMMATVLGSQLSDFENSDTQSRETSRIPGFVVPQQFDQPANYYTQMYRAAAEGDGRLSPFLVPGTAKYNGNPAILSNQSFQQPQEGGNSPVQSTSGPASVGTQGSGASPTSIALAQQPAPLFRQPPGVHLSHYPPGYIQPYSQYIPSFYIPPPALHPFLSNAAFPQQHPAGGIYPPPVPGGTAPVKYSVSQFKSAANSGNSINTGLATGYGLYSSTSTGYSPSPATSTVNSTSSEDLSASQYKENNLYLAGQQSEGSAVWIPAPSRDHPGANSFYNISPQAQHLAFTPSQAGHGTFPAVYHAPQTMANPVVHPLLQQSQAVAGAVEMVGPPGGVYQQPQRAQINWANNY